MKKLPAILIGIILVLSSYITWRISIGGFNSNPVDAPPLIIQELGLRIEQTAETGAITYHPMPDASQPTVALSSKELTKRSNGLCAADKTAPPIGTLTELGKPVDSLDASLVVDSQTVFLVADSYYLLTRPQAPCSTNSALTVLANRQRQAFVRALTSATSTKDESQK